jgi:hypothetical protein
MTRALKFVLIFASMAGAGPLDLTSWKYRKKIPLTPENGIAVVRIDREVYAAIGSRDSKLRVYRDAEEVPFIFGPAGKKTEDRVLTQEEILDQSILPGVGLQFTIHRRESGVRNKLEISTDLKNFRNRVRIETSQDGNRWAIARDDGAIFNFSQDGNEFSSTSVVYPPSTRRYLRVTIFGWTKNGSVVSAVVDRKENLADVFEVFGINTPEVSEDRERKSTVAQIDLGTNGLPVEFLRLETSAPQIQRAVGVEHSDDGKNWSFGSGGTIARLPGSEFTEESLTVGVSGGHRFYRLRIYNRDDKPIQVGRIQSEGRGHLLKFLAQTPGNYWLYYDGPDFTAEPQYDLPIVLSRQSLPEHPWTLGTQESNPVYRPPSPPKKPWSEQHPAILYTVLGGAVLALGIATFRFASRLKPAP